MLTKAIERTTVRWGGSRHWRTLLAEERAPFFGVAVRSSAFPGIGPDHHSSAANGGFPFAGGFICGHLEGRGWREESVGKASYDAVSSTGAGVRPLPMVSILCPPGRIEPKGRILFVAQKVGDDILGVGAYNHAMSLPPDHVRPPALSLKRNA